MSSCFFRFENVFLAGGGSGDIAVFVSVGAGMNVNAMVYKEP